MIDLVIIFGPKLLLVGLFFITSVNLYYHFKDKKYKTGKNSILIAV